MFIESSPVKGEAGVAVGPLDLTGEAARPGKRRARGLSLSMLVEKTRG